MLIENKKSKVVIDTNVFISGLNFAGKPNEVLELFIKGEIEVYISPFILKELEEILRKKFEWNEKQLQKILDKIKKKAVIVQAETKISIIKAKEDDNRILECGVDGKVQYIISGDKRHILPLKNFRGIKILSPSEFLGLLNG